MLRAWGPISTIIIPLLLGALAAVEYRLEPRGTVECACRLLPATRNVIVVSGTADADRALLQAAQAQFAMEERISLVGGEIAISSAPGKGTSIEARVPLLEDNPVT